MTPNNNFSVLPFYRNLSEQNHRKSYAYGQIYPLIVPLTTLIPFQIMRETSTGTINTVKVELMKKDGTLFANISEAMIDAGMQLAKFPSLGYDVIVFTGLFPLGVSIPEGMYYLSVNDGVYQWYSDIFTAVARTDGYLKIEWYDAENLVFDAGVIVYKNPRFKNILYLCTELGKPEYPFEEEGETRDGYFFPEKQISEKTYKCTALAPEYLCDVMRFIRMSDFVFVTDKYGRVYDCDTFLITPKWQTQGDLASVEIEFDTATVVKKIGKGYIAGDDFNNDFNNDFSIKI